MHTPAGALSAGSTVEAVLPPGSACSPLLNSNRSTGCRPSGARWPESHGMAEAGASAGAGTTSDTDSAGLAWGDGERVQQHVN